MDNRKLYGSNQNKIDSLVRAVEIVTKDIDMNVGMDKCVVLPMKKGKQVECNGIELEHGEKIGLVGEEGYKYLGILEKEDICQEDIKENIRKGYLRGTLKLKLNAKNVFQAINTWVMPTARYSAGNIEWTKEKVKVTDRKTRKIITMYGGLHPRAISERLYLPRSEGGMELLSIEDCVSDGRKNLALYPIRSNEKFIIASATELKLKKFIIVPNRQQRRKQRLTEWKEKSLHSQFLREIEGTDDGHSREWLKRWEIKRETETLMCAALEQALQVNTIKYSVDKTSNTPLCRPCNEKTESITHIVRACSI